MEIENKIWAIVNPDDEQDSFTSADDEPISIEDQFSTDFHLKDYFPTLDR